MGVWADCGLGGPAPRNFDFCMGDIDRIGGPGVTRGYLAVVESGFMAAPSRARSEALRMMRGFTSMMRLVLDFTFSRCVKSAPTKGIWPRMGILRSSSVSS